MAEDVIGICFLFFFCGEVLASSEVSLDLTGYVDPEVNIERLDNNGTLDIFQKVASYYRVTSNTEKNIKVTFSSKNGWKLKKEGNDSVFIPYVGEFSGRDRDVTVGEISDSVVIEKDSFYDREYDFKVVFGTTGSMKNFDAGRYYDRITISVSAEG